jgi:hypothetical protein
MMVAVIEVLPNWLNVFEHKETDCGLRVRSLVP